MLHEIDARTRLLQWIKWYMKDIYSWLDKMRYWKWRRRFRRSVIANVHRRKIIQWARINQRSGGGKHSVDPSHPTLCSCSPLRWRVDRFQMSVKHLSQEKTCWRLILKHYGNKVGRTCKVHDVWYITQWKWDTRRWSQIEDNCRIWRRCNSLVLYPIV